MARAVGSAIRIFCGVLIAGSIGVVVTPTSAADNSDASQKVELGDQRDASDLAMRGIGRVLWKRQPGTSDFDEARGVATDRQDNVYVVGETGGALGGPNKGGVDAWVIKYDWSGRVLWKRQPGTDGGDSANAVATDEEGNVYVAGRSEESTVLLQRCKYNGHGRVLWKRRFATSGDDLANGIATDKDGNVYIVGVTQGELFRPNNMLDDAWIVKLDGNGHALWKRQFGTDWSDAANAVATDRHGNVYVVGDTGGALGGANKGIIDAWVIKFEGGGGDERR